MYRVLECAQAHIHTRAFFFLLLFGIAIPLGFDSVLTLALFSFNFADCRRCYCCFPKNFTRFLGFSPEFRKQFETCSVFSQPYRRPKRKVKATRHGARARWNDNKKNTTEHEQEDGRKKRKNKSKRKQQHCDAEKVDNSVRAAPSVVGERRSHSHFLGSIFYCIVVHCATFYRSECHNCW